MKMNLKKLATGTLIVGALLAAEAYISHVVTDYELTKKDNVQQEETNINTIKEEEPEAESAELNVNTNNDNTTYTNQTVQQPIQTTPLTIDDVKVFDTDLYDNTLEVTYTVVNNTDKHINRIDAHVYCVDANGNRLTDTFTQIDVDLTPHTSNYILSKDILLPKESNYSYVVVEATDFRF